MTIGARGNGLEKVATDDRAGKGNKDRVTLLPDALSDPLRRHLETVKTLHERDLEAGFGSAPLPGALSKKYPYAEKFRGGKGIYSPDPAGVSAGGIDSDDAVHGDDALAGSLHDQRIDFRFEHGGRLQAGEIGECAQGPGERRRVAALR